MLKPAFPTNNAAIVLAANEYFAPYLSVVLESLRCHVSGTWNYDVILLHQDMSLKNQDILKMQVAAEENISLRFLDVGEYSGVFKRMFIKEHFTQETYFRLLLPKLLAGYEKALYLDSDLILCADPAELYQTDVNGYLLAACRDIDMAGSYNGFVQGRKEYIDTVLNIREPYGYFQAGVLLLNLQEFRRKFKVRELFRFAASYHWEFLDQDVLNYMAQGQVKYVDMAWNVLTDWRGLRVGKIIPCAPVKMQEEYAKARRSAKILHYAGDDKPWQRPDADRAAEFWSYARTSPYYEVILQRMCTPRADTSEARPKGWMKMKDMRIFTMLFPYKTRRREWLKRIAKRAGRRRTEWKKGR